MKCFTFRCPPSVSLVNERRRGRGLCMADAVTGARKRALPERLAPALGASAKRAARRSPVEDNNETADEEEESGEVVAEAEGFTLPLSKKSATGYVGVSKNGGRYAAKVWSGGRQVSIGNYGTAVEAAVAYARWQKGGPAAVAQAREAQAAASAAKGLATEAEGLELHLAKRSDNTTGYEGVTKARGGRYEAQVKSGGRKVHIGYYDTAVEAAAGYARWRKDPAAVAQEREAQVEAKGLATEAEGLELHLAKLSNNTTGYAGVCKQGGRYQAHVQSGGRKVFIGSYGTAVEAAVAYARLRRANDEAAAPPAHDDAAVKVEAEEESDSEQAEDGGSEAEAAAGAGGMDEVRAALASLGLAEYAAAFEAAGYDDLDYLLSLPSRADGQARVDGVAAAAAMRPGHASKLAAYLRGAWHPTARSGRTR